MSEANERPFGRVNIVEVSGEAQPLEKLSKLDSRPEILRNSEVEGGDEGESK